MLLKEQVAGKILKVVKISGSVMCHGNIETLKKRVLSYIFSEQINERKLCDQLQKECILLFSGRVYGGSMDAWSTLTHHVYCVIQLLTQV